MSKVCEIKIKKGRLKFKIRPIGRKSFFSVRKIFAAILLCFASIGNIVPLVAFEAHVINATAHVCNYTQIRPMDYWKQHPNTYALHLPQTLGTESIGTVLDADNVFALSYGSSSNNKLKGQLLALKFNIAHYGTGDYVYDNSGKTLNDLALEADLLLQDPGTPDPDLEQLNSLIDYLNNLVQIKYCSQSPPQAGSSIVINEVYYDVKCHGLEGWSEWVELYNTSDSAVDLSGWKIKDNAEETVIPAGTILPPLEFAVITPNESTWYWWPQIPVQALKVVLGKKIGNGLANDGDRVILLDASGQEMDAVSWGSDAYAFDPPVPLAQEGYSIAREIKGYDTDAVLDWIDLAWPNPGTNPHDENGTPIQYQGEIGCPAGEQYVPETRDSSEDPGQYFPLLPIPQSCATTTEQITLQPCATTTQEIVPQGSATTTQEISLPQASTVQNPVSQTGPASAGASNTAILPSLPSSDNATTSDSGPFSASVSSNDSSAQSSAPNDSPPKQDPNTGEGQTTPPETFLLQQNTQPSSQPAAQTLQASSKGRTAQNQTPNTFELNFEP